jgi:hypothetical protein
MAQGSTLMTIDRAALKKLRAKNVNGLRTVALELTSHAKRRATRHMDNGTRRNSITHSIEGAAVLWGIPRRSAPHAVPLEQGFRPHWVPGRYIGLWMKRKQVGVSRLARINGRVVRSGRTVRAMALGLYVGGPGSTLQSAPGGTGGLLFAGRGRRRMRHWRTRGGESRYLSQAKVGHPILQPTAREDLPRFSAAAFKRGYERG